MLPINHLVRTLVSTGKSWELLSHTADDAQHFTSRIRYDNLDVVVTQRYDHWYTTADRRIDLSAILNKRKPTPLVTTDLLTGKKGILSFATQELKDDFLRHAPVMESPDKEAAE